MAKPAKSNGTLPASIVNALPTAAHIMATMKIVEKEIPRLEKELVKARKGGAVQMARAFVALRRLEERINEILEPLVGQKKETPGLLHRYRTVEVPRLFEQEGVSSIPLAEGFRVGISARFMASIRPDKRDEAYGWLRSNGLEDVIQPTVNASTLSAALKREMEENNKEAPEDLFNIAMMPTTSVTSTK